MKENITEFEQKVLDAIDESIIRQEDDRFSESVFIAKLRKIMPPTCLPTERKFLDRIREIGYWEEEGDERDKTINFPSGYISQEDFSDVDLKEFVNE